MHLTSLLNCLLNTLIRPNKKNPVFRVTQPYLNLLVKRRIFLGFLEKNIILCILKCIKSYFFSRKKIFKKKGVPTLPKIFRPVTRNALGFLANLCDIAIFFVTPQTNNGNIFFTKILGKLADQDPHCFQ